MSSVDRVLAAINAHAQALRLFGASTSAHADTVEDCKMEPCQIAVRILRHALWTE